MKTYAEKLSELSVKLADLSNKAAVASEDARIGHELRKEAIQEKINAAKGSVVNLQEDVRNAGEEREGKMRTALLKAKMTIKAKNEDRKDARDKKHLENFMDDEILYILECYDAAAYLIAEAELSVLEVAEAMKEYEERFVSKEE